MLCCATYIVNGSMHAYCNMELTVSGVTIAKLNSSLISEVKHRAGFNDSCIYASEGDEFCGYSITSTSVNDDHFTHETPVNHYIDDLHFLSWTASDDGVVVQAHSKSETTSVYDYDTNFCLVYEYI